MNETAVVVSLCEWLDNKGFRFFIDASYSSPEIQQLPDRLEHCGWNRTIRIENRIPDLIGFTPQGRIFAVEAKGTHSIRKGIGQAAHYRQGVHKSYLAADAESLEEFQETALSCGIGLYPVTSQEVQPPKEPNANITATQLKKTQRELAIKTSGTDSAGKAFGSMTRPVNAFLPVIYLAQNDSSTVSPSRYRKWVDQHPHGINYSMARHTIALAKTLQFVQLTSKGSNLALTDIGQCGYNLLRGHVEVRPQNALGLNGGESPENKNDVLMQYLAHLKTNGRRKLYQDAPEIAAFLRDRYLSIPDLRLLLKVLSAHEGTRIELSFILAKIALESSSIFSNLFVKRGSQDEFSEMMKESKLQPYNKEFRSRLLEVASRDYLYNFIYQIWHIGILQDGTRPVHQTDDELEIEKFYWEWDEESVGELSLDVI